jgi:hypothetical protein
MTVMINAKISARQIPTRILEHQLNLIAIAKEDFFILKGLS